MSNTIIQIRRSTTTGTPTDLQPGELAYTSNGEILFIGSVEGTNTANVVPIAGKRYPGTLTANQALVANNSAWIDNVQTAKLIVGPVGTTINIASVNATSNSSQLGLNANNELATTFAIQNYVNNRTANLTAAGANTQVYFSNNTVLAGNDAFTFNYTTGVLSLSNAVSIGKTLNVGANVNVDTGSISVGNSSVNVYANSSYVRVNNALVTNSANVTTILNVGANVNLSTSSINVGNSTVNSSITSTSVDLDGVLNTGNTTVSGFTTITGTANVGGSLNVVNAAAFSNNVSITGTLSVNSSVNFDTNVALGNNSTDIISVNGVVNTHVVPSSNLSYDIGSGTNYWRNIYSGNAYFTNVLVNGDLNVQGTLTTIDTVNLTIKDPLFALADQQANTSVFTDSVDIGFYGEYGNTSQTIHTGLVRQATSNTYVLFDGLLNQTPNNVVNTAAVSIATLNAYLSSGGLRTNTTSVAITSNSTIAVTITANTLTLNSALGVASGGTGKQSVTNNAVLFGYGTGALQEATGSNGQVLQITSNVPTFAGLDGGTF